MLDPFALNSIYISVIYYLTLSLFDNFNSAVSNSLELFAPITVSPNRSYSKSPWFSNELVNLRRSLRQLHTKYQLTNLDADLKVSCSIYRCKLLTYKSSYFTGKLNNLGMSSKQAFNLSFKMIGRDLNKHLPDQPDSFLFTAFSSFFQRKISLIIDSLPIIDPALFAVTHISSTNHW